MSSHFYPEVSLIVASVPDDGRQVEVRAGRLEDPPLPDGTTPYIAAFRAEREGEIRMVFRLGSTIVEVPVEEIERAIGLLRPEYRTAIVLRHVEGRPYEEISEIMGVPLGTVKTYIHRARGELKETLAHLRVNT